VETEKKDKIFRKPIPIKARPLRQKVILAVVIFIFGVLGLIGFRTAAMAVFSGSNKSPLLTLRCTNIGVPRLEERSKFTFVLFGHLTLSERDLRTALQAFRSSIEEGDNVVIALRKPLLLHSSSIGDTAVQNAIADELHAFVNSTDIVLCESTHAHEVWRILWKRNYVAKDFIIFDQISMLSSLWREWMEQMRDMNPQALISLQHADPHYCIEADQVNQFKVSTMPSLSALSPPHLIWMEFLTWFDANPTEYRRLSGASLPGDIEDGWMLLSRGHHGGWAKPFAQFIARKGYQTIHAHPPLGYSIYERRV